MKAMRNTGNKITMCFQFCYGSIIKHLTQLFSSVISDQAYFPSLPHTDIYMFSYITKNKDENEESKLISLQKYNLIGS